MQPNYVEAIISLFLIWVLLVLLFVLRVLLEAKDTEE